MAEAHTSLGSIAQWSWNFSLAEREFLRAIDLKPNYATGHQAYAFFLSRVRGKFKEALAEIKVAQHLDRLSPRMGTNAAQIYAGLGEFDASIQELRNVLELEPNYAEAHRFLGVVYRKQRRYEEAISELVYAALGQNEQSFKWIEKDFQVRASSLFLIAYNPRGDILREKLGKDPRWKDLLQRIGLPTP